MTVPSPSSQAKTGPGVSPDDSSHSRQTAFRLSRRGRIIFFLAAWLIVLMPFLFWWSTWFGRPLSEQQIAEYLGDEKHPRHIQHALVQLGDRMAGHDLSAKRWYPEIARLSGHPVEEVRNTDAWVMGQDTSDQAFHDALRKMLDDPSLNVRGNAALSLVRFGDPSGRAQIVLLLEPASITAPDAGRVVDIDKAGTSVHQGGLVAKLLNGQRTIEVRSPIAGRVEKPAVTPGAAVNRGAELAVVDPAEAQVWEALRALYLVGRPEDLQAIRVYRSESGDTSNRVRQQAVLTEEAILRRARQDP
jgi:hypothetical protein